VVLDVVMIFAGVCTVSTERSMKLRLYYNYNYYSYKNSRKDIAVPKMRSPPESALKRKMIDLI
jgi:hypothetical protein